MKMCASTYNVNSGSSTAYVLTPRCLHNKKAIPKLKSNKIDEGGILFSIIFIHGTDLLFVYLSMALHLICFFNHRLFPFQKVHELMYRIQICI